MYHSGRFSFVLKDYGLTGLMILLFQLILIACGEGLKVDLPSPGVGATDKLQCDEKAYKYCTKNEIAQLANPGNVLQAKKYPQCGDQGQLTGYSRCEIVRCLDGYEPAADGSECLSLSCRSSEPPNERCDVVNDSGKKVGSGFYKKSCDNGKWQVDRSYCPLMQCVSEDRKVANNCAQCVSGGSKTQVCYNGTAPVTQYASCDSDGEWK